MGMRAVVAPLFEMTAVEWQAPDPAGYDALLLTSANAPRYAGPELSRLATLTCYCVGEATAAVARQAGFGEVRMGPSDAGALLRMMAEDGSRRVLQLCGRDRIDLQHPALEIARVTVYAADAVDRLPPQARAALDQGAVTLLHSPRAARLFGRLVDEAGLNRSALRIAAISQAAADAAGHGWAAVRFAEHPRDQPLLEVAAKLCNSGSESGTG